MTFPPEDITVDIRFVVPLADWAPFADGLKNLADDVGFEYQVITD